MRTAEVKDGGGEGGWVMQLRGDEWHANTCWGLKEKCFNDTTRVDWNWWRIRRKVFFTGEIVNRLNLDR